MIPMQKIRRSRDRVLFNTELPIPGKDGLYIETGPCLSYIARCHAKWNYNGRHPCTIKLLSNWQYANIQYDFIDPFVRVCKVTTKKVWRQEATKTDINSLWPNDDLWRHIYELTLAMAFSDVMTRPQAMTYINSDL